MAIYLGPTERTITGIYLPVYTGVSGYTTYYQQGTSPEDGTESVSYSTAGNLTKIKRIEALATAPVYPTQLLISITSEAGALLISGAEDFYGVTIEDLTPGNSTAWYAFSFDKGASYSVFTGSAWKAIVQLDSTTWQYWDGAAYQNASSNDVGTALEEAWGVSANKKDSTAINAWTQANWKATGGWVLYQVPSIGIAFGLTVDGTDVPKFTSATAQIADFGVLALEPFRNGAWQEGESWTDGTTVDTTPLAQSGIISYDGTVPDYSTATYATINGVPGFHYRLRVPGTASDCSIAQIKYQAPPQYLQNIGTTGPDVCSAVLWEDVSEGTVTDISAQMADYTYSEVASAEIPLETGDRLYFCSPYRYNEIEITPFAANSNSASFTGEYHDGGAWRSITFADGTKAISGKTLSGPGKFTFTLPEVWELTMPFDTHHVYGRWTRFTVSTTLTSTTALAEARVYVVPDSLPKYRFAALVDNRLALCNRPQARDQVDLSRPYEEYGFCGQNSGSYRLGGADGIKSVVSAYNGLLLSSREMWSQIRGDGQGGFSTENVEAARYVPCNQEVIIKAPYEHTDGTQNGLFFLNAYGAWVSTGLQVDTLWNTARGVNIGQPVSWWDVDQYPRLDLDNLASVACGQFYPPKNWLVWSVPWLVASDSSPQTTNNRLLVYDLTLRKWLPPMDLAMAALELCYETNGTVGLYGGSYDACVIRIFSGDADVVTDHDAVGVEYEDADIPWTVETGWLNFDSPQVVKYLEGIKLYATGTPTNLIESTINWVNDSTDGDVGLTGHFSSDVTDTVSVGDVVLFDSGVRAFIATLDNDGTGDSDVVLVSGTIQNLPTESITAIYKPILVNFRRDGGAADLLTTPIRIDAVTGQTSRPFHYETRWADIPFNFLKIIITGYGPVQFGWSLTISADDDETE